MDSPPTQRLRPAHDRTTEVDDLTPVPVTEIAQADAPLGARYQTLGLATINCRAGVTLGRALGGRAVLDIANAAEGLVALGDLIATGGMGEVRSAVQHRLRREVAVKRARGDASEETHQAMLREAWIAGSLEHPNILPIHTLSRDGSEPLIVMKRVYGRVWTELLRDQRLAPGDARWVEPIGVLVEVCRAVHFAHSRGVLHLDLKPDNVMVGEHGEVVLLDWGVAAAFDTSLAPDFITKTDSITHVCGTLGYLSPEQATAHGASFGPTTDVYLLGAILHEIITGHPPHLSPHTSLVASLVSSHRAEPPVFDASVPEELRAIARRALARAPADRFPDVDAFRHALELFLEHRPALLLTTKADALREEIAFARASMSERSSMQALNDEASTEAQLDACRFAYQQALRSWPECEEAQKGLGALAELRMAQAEATLDVAAGRSALDDHPAPPEELLERLRALEQAAADDAAHVEALRALSADESLDTDRALRIRLALTGGGCWSVWNAVTGYLDQSGALPITTNALLTHVTMAFAMFLAVLASVGRRALTSTAVNRRALTIVFAAFAETFILWLGGAVLGIEAHQTAVLAFAVYVLAGLAVAAVLDPRTWWGAALMLLPAFGAAHTPEHVFYYTACLGPIGGVGLAYLWWRPATAEEAAEAKA